MKDLLFNKLIYRLPSKLEDLTFEQLSFIILQEGQLNDLKIVSYFLNLKQEEVVKTKDISGYSAVLKQLSNLFVTQIDFSNIELPKSFDYNGNTYKIPNDIGDLNIETFEYCRSLLGNTNISENTKDYLDVIFKISAFYIREIIKREEDVDDLFLESIKQVNGLFILSFGNFFLQKLTDLVNGITQIIKKPSLMIIIKEQVFKRFQNVGGFFTNLKQRVISVLLKKKSS